MIIKPTKEACEKYYQLVLPWAVEIAKKKKEEKNEKVVSRKGA